MMRSRCRRRGSLRLLAAVLLLGLLVGSGCALRSSKIELQALDSPGLEGELAALDSEALTRRMDGLFSALSEGKFTIHLTGAKITDYFKDPEQLDVFIAVMADLLRESGFERQRIERYRLGRIVIEPNGVIAHAEVTYWGHFYFIWSAKAHQAITWKKEEGTWYVFMPKRPARD